MGRKLELDVSKRLEALGDIRLNGDACSIVRQGGKVIRGNCATGSRST